MSKKNLLICFDAFGTLFKPRQPIAKQYAEVATTLELRGITEDAVERSFRTAFKNESKQNPNYGKANGLNAEKWWRNIITNTFAPLLQKDSQLPSELVSKLLHRFWSNEGYVLLPDVHLVLRGARNLQHLTYKRVVLGVITNSDDRVPDVLNSLGLKVSPLRYGAEHAVVAKGSVNWDVDFSVMSYDVGVEKPDRRIFEAAEEMAGSLADFKGEEGEAVEWEKVYVGDEYRKDVVGAVEAGWKAVLIDEGASSQKDGLIWRDDDQPGSLQDLFQSSNAIGLRSLTKFAEWLR